MATKYFKCKLLSDVVVNASLATEGNMQSLDYIPGSNFLGIVANEYEQFGPEAYDIFHSGKVSFGDALISKNDKRSYRVPFSLYLDKLKNDITKDKVWVQTKLAEIELPKDETTGNSIQLKQHRTGYLNTDSVYIPKVEKEFALKSAYNPKERRSDDGKMYGFEAIKAGQEFIFSVIFDEEKYVQPVANALVGEKRIGKSKTAQYGLVKIEVLEQVPEKFESRETKNNELMIYAESNLCFLNEYGQSTFQPLIKDFGLEKGTINWSKSQIRTYSYSPWNTTRNASDTQRDVILRGSVIVIEGVDVDVNTLPEMVGEFQNEGLGRVIYNSKFLDYNEADAAWTFKLIPQNNNGNNQKNTSVKKEKLDVNQFNSPLGKIAAIKNNVIVEELEIGEKIIDVMEKESFVKNNKITKSQWGAIRTAASNASSVEELIDYLFKPKTGYLMHGVAAERIWDKHGGKDRKALKKVIENNKELGTKFVAKLAAEIAKKH